MKLQLGSERPRMFCPGSLTAKAGLVIVSADDPAMHSSHIELDISPLLVLPDGKEAVTVDPRFLYTVSDVAVACLSSQRYLPRRSGQALIGRRSI